MGQHGEAPDVAAQGRSGTELVAARGDMLVRAFVRERIDEQHDLVQSMSSEHLWAVERKGARTDKWMRDNDGLVLWFANAANAKAYLAAAGAA